MTMVPSQEQLLLALLRYIPPALARMIYADPRPPTAPRALAFDAAIVLADVSGFTALTEKLAMVGGEGAEQLTSILNNYFTRMIDEIVAEGGEVVQFSGDALIAVFPTVVDGYTHMTLADAVQRAHQAAARMQDAMTSFATIPTSVGAVSLGMKAIIGAGRITSMMVGGVFNRWQYLIAGGPMAQIALAEKSAKRGEIVLSPEAHALFPDAPLGPHALTLPRWQTVTEETLAAMRSYVPRAIALHLIAGQSDWVAEIRRVAILFLGIGGLSDVGDDALAHAHAAMTGIQQIVYRYEGSINKLLMDDKGTIAIVLFGAPPFAHIDDPLRAVRCAQDLQRAADDLGLRLAIGVTAGQVFLGPVGSDTRREYTVIGTAVNLAARLMQSAGRYGIRCDHAVYQAARNDVAWEALAPLVLKGFPTPVRAYVPTGARGSRTAVLRTSRLIGRAAELAHLQRALDTVAAGGSRTLLMTGESGMGKTRMIDALVAVMRERGIAGLEGRGLATEQQTPYRAWGEIFEAYFDIDRLSDVAQRREQVIARLSELAPHLLLRAPLLNDLLAVQIAETALTAALDPKLRQASLSALLIELLMIWSSREPLVLFLEDAHWFDPRSWAFAIEVVRSLAATSALVVIALRPLEATPADHPLLQFGALSGVERLALGPLSDTEVIALVADRLSVSDLPAALALLVAQRADGNPFVAEELAASLRESPLVAIGNGRCTLRGRVEDILLPENVQGLVLSRIDRLRVDQQLALKVASVIGRVFSVTAQRAVYPGTIAAEQISALLASLEEREILAALGTTTVLASHEFRQSLVQEVVYDTLLHTQRRTLHARVAEWYERHLGAYADLHALLAYHWRRAGEVDRELRSSELAARQFARAYANQEALVYLERAIELTTAPAALLDLLWLRLELHTRMGDSDARRTDLDTIAAIVETGDDLALAVQLAIGRGEYLRDISDYPAAIAVLDLAEQLAQDADDQAAETRTLTTRGQVLEYQGTYDEAEQCFSLALGLCRQRADQHGEAASLAHIGNIRYYRSDYTGAREFDRRALAIRRAIGDRAGEVVSLNNLAHCSISLLDFAAARSYTAEAEQIARQIGDRAGEALSVGTFGDLCLLLGDVVPARDSIERAIQIYRALGERRRAANLVNQLGQVWRDVGDTERAQALFTDALDSLIAIGDLGLAAYTAINLGSVEIDTKPDLARAHFEQALTLARETGSADAEAYALAYCALHAESYGDLAAARTDLLAALEIRTTLETEATLVELRAQLARVALKQQEIDEARSIIEDCLVYLDDRGTEGIEFPVQLALSCYDVLVAAGEPTRARLVLGDAVEQLRARAAATTDDDMRSGMLQRVAANRRAISEWEKVEQHADTPLRSG